jgi:hypothetical protein
MRGSPSRMRTEKRGSRSAARAPEKGSSRVVEGRRQGATREAGLATPSCGQWHPLEGEGYIAALYVASPSNDAKAILDPTTRKQLVQ